MHNANVGRHTECAVASFQYLRPCLIIQHVVLIFARMHVRYYMCAHEKSHAHIVQLLPPNISSCVLRSASFVLLSTRLTYWQNIYKIDKYKYFHYSVKILQFWHKEQKYLSSRDMMITILHGFGVLTNRTKMILNHTFPNEKIKTNTSPLSDQTWEPLLCPENKYRDTFGLV